MSLSRRFPIVAALTLLLCGACGAGGPTAPAPAPAPSSDSAFVAALRARLEAETKAGAFSGAVLVTRDGRTLFEGAYGLADREQGVPNTPLTQFRVGSMNKMLTAVAVLQLVQAGKVRLDAPLGTYLPDYPNAEVASKVTLHHLLTHTGGTGDIFGPEFTAHRSELRTTEDYLRLYGTRGLRFEPGTRWEYSNYGFLLLGAVIERVEGTSYYDYVEARVHAPAGMTATGSAPEDSLVPGRAVGYTRQLVPGALVSNAPSLPYRGTAAGGGYSTVGDLARFAVALREHRLLDPAHTALLLGGKVPIGQGVQYAYGFFDRVQVGRRLVGHGGSAPGMNGELTFEPNGGYVVVVLSNLDPSAATRVEAFILDRLPTSTLAEAGGVSAARSAPMAAWMSRATREAIVLRVPSPTGFYPRWLDGRVDDPNAGWKGRGLRVALGTRTLHHRGRGTGPPARDPVPAPPGAAGEVRARHDLPIDELPSLEV